MMDLGYILGGKRKSKKKSKSSIISNPKNHTRVARDPIARDQPPKLRFKTRPLIKRRRKPILDIKSMDMGYKYEDEFDRKIGVKYKHKMIPIEFITPGEPLHEKDKSKIQDLISSSRPIPPIKVFNRRGPLDTYQVWDGHHRFAAALARGDLQIPAKVYHKNWNVKYDREHKPELKLTQKDVAKIAEEHYGITDNPAEAGFIMPSGKMLDFSGRHQMGSSYKKIGGKYLSRGQDYQAGKRDVDHSDTHEVIGKTALDKINTSERDSYTLGGRSHQDKELFKKATGGIRFNMSQFKGKSHVDIDIRKDTPLTQEQKHVLKKIAKEWQPEDVSYDVTQTGEHSSGIVPSMNKAIEKIESEQKKEKVVTLPEQDKPSMNYWRERFNIARKHGIRFDVENNPDDLTKIPVSRLDTEMKSLRPMTKFEQKLVVSTLTKHPEILRHEGFESMSNPKIFRQGYNRIPDTFFYTADIKSREAGVHFPEHKSIVIDERLMHNKLPLMKPQATILHEYQHHKQGKSKTRGQHNIEQEIRETDAEDTTINLIKTRKMQQIKNEIKRLSQDPSFKELNKDQKEIEVTVALGKKYKNWKDTGKPDLETRNRMAIKAIKQLEEHDERMSPEIKQDESPSMAWDIRGAKRRGEYIVRMSPVEYLRRAGTRLGDWDTDMDLSEYRDTETGMEPIEKLWEHIQSDKTKVAIPYVGDTHTDQEGRHRAYAAYIGGRSKIPVATTIPKEKRMKYYDEFVSERFPDQPPSYKSKWKSRFKEGYPQVHMDNESKEVLAKIIEKDRKDEPDQDESPNFILNHNGYHIKYVGRNTLKDYAGMNHWAGKVMGFHPLPAKKTLLIDKHLDPLTKQKTIVHEEVESSLMQHGVPYWKAHKTALQAENHITQDRISSNLGKKSKLLDNFLADDSPSDSEYLQTDTLNNEYNLIKDVIYETPKGKEYLEYARESNAKLGMDKPGHLSFRSYVPETPEEMEFELGKKRTLRHKWKNMMIMRDGTEDTEDWLHEQYDKSIHPDQDESPNLKVDGKPVILKDKHYKPDIKKLDKWYSKIDDDRSMPLVFQKKDSYLKEYLHNQEIAGDKKFSKAQKKRYMDEGRKLMAGVVARYTTKHNPFMEAKVVVFTDHKIPNKLMKRAVFHEYGHELAERKGWEMPRDREEAYADKVSQDLTSRNMGAMADAFFEMHKHRFSKNPEPMKMEGLLLEKAQYQALENVPNFTERQKATVAIKNAIKATKYRHDRVIEAAAIDQSKDTGMPLETAKELARDVINAIHTPAVMQREAETSAKDALARNIYDHTSYDVLDDSKKKKIDEIFENPEPIDKDVSKSMRIKIRQDLSSRNGKIGELIDKYSGKTLEIPIISKTIQDESGLYHTRQDSLTLPMVSKKDVNKLYREESKHNFSGRVSDFGDASISRRLIRTYVRDNKLDLPISSMEDINEKFLEKRQDLLNQINKRNMPATQDDSPTFRFPSHDIHSLNLATRIKNMKQEGKWVLSEQPMAGSPRDYDVNFEYQSPMFYARMKKNYHENN